MKTCFCVWTDFQICPENLGNLSSSHTSIENVRCGRALALCAAAPGAKRAWHLWQQQPRSAARDAPPGLRHRRASAGSGWAAGGREKHFVLRQPPAKVRRAPRRATKHAHHKDTRRLTEVFGRAGPDGRTGAARGAPRASGREVAGARQPAQVRKKGGASSKTARRGKGEYGQHARVLNASEERVHGEQRAQKEK